MPGALVSLALQMEGQQAFPHLSAHLNPAALGALDMFRPPSEASWSFIKNSDLDAHALPSTAQGTETWKNA